MNITFDLETLGNTANAPIVQIGAVKFDDDGKVIDQFLADIDLNSLQQYNFKIDYNTLSWWLNQSPEAVHSVFEEHHARISLSKAIWQFTEWIGKTTDYYYWSHATFDPPILQNTFKELGIPNPIPFRLHRDIRTLYHFAGKINIPRTGIHHNALDDCIYQAAYIAQGFKQIKK